MATHQSAIKRNRQSKRLALRNRQYRSTMRTVIKKVLESKDKSSAEPTLRNAVSLLDKMAAVGIIHRNKAAHQKSRLTLHFNKLP
jgi:small subunit ribosomal protein S20